MCTGLQYCMVVLFIAAPVHTKSLENNMHGQSHDTGNDVLHHLESTAEFAKDGSHLTLGFTPLTDEENPGHEGLPEDGLKEHELNKTVSESSGSEVKQTDMDQLANGRGENGSPETHAIYNETSIPSEQKIDIQKIETNEMKDQDNDLFSTVHAMKGNEQNTNLTIHQTENPEDLKRKSTNKLREEIVNKPEKSKSKQLEETKKLNDTEADVSVEQQRHNNNDGIPNTNENNENSLNGVDSKPTDEQQRENIDFQDHKRSSTVIEITTTITVTPKTKIENEFKENVEKSTATHTEPFVHDKTTRKLPNTTTKLTKTTRKLTRTTRNLPKTTHFTITPKEVARTSVTESANKSTLHVQSYLSDHPVIDKTSNVVLAKTLNTTPKKIVHRVEEATTTPLHPWICNGGYTRGAVITGIIGGIILGGGLATAFFILKLRCRRYVKGDYRPVPMEYDFELNPRFKTH